MSTLKEDGNAHFRKGENLKAAACYTKAIKASPEDATLYSNRSAALLKLKKVSKAIADAEKCIQLDSKWAKGYFRLARAHEVKGNKEAMIAALEAGHLADPENEDLLNKLAAAKGEKRPASKKAEEKAEAKRASEAAAAVAAATASAPPAAASGGGGIQFTVYTGPKMEGCDVREVVHACKMLTDPAAEQIANVITTVMAELHSNFKEKPFDVLLRPTAFLIPSDPSLPQPCIAIEKAFTSPDNHRSCTQFLRESIAKDECVLAVLTVEKEAIMYPRQWEGKTTTQWAFDDNIHGVFIQVESHNVRFIFFYPIYVTGEGKSEMSLDAPVHLDPDRFALIPPLCR